MSALKRIVNKNTSYQLSISEGGDEDDANEDEAYKAKLSCNPANTEFMLYDDVHDLHGMRTGAARRELGLIVMPPRPRGQTVHFDFVVPRVQSDGTSAQYRPKSISDTILSSYKVRVYAWNTVDMGMHVLRIEAGCTDYGSGSMWQHQEYSVQTPSTDSKAETQSVDS